MPLFDNLIGNQFVSRGNSFNAYTNVLAGNQGVSALHNQYLSSQIEWERQQSRERALAEALQSITETVPLAPMLINVASASIVAKVMAWADENKLNTKERCRMLGIPWVARLVPKSACSANMAVVVGMLPPSTFAQTLPLDPDHAGLWARLVSVAGRNAVWMAHNAMEMVRLSHRETAINAADYVAYVMHTFTKTKSPAVVLRESAEWHRIRYEREMEMLRNRFDHRAGGWYDGGPDKIELPYADRLPIRSGDYSLHIFSEREEAREEGRVMHHCVAGYWGRNCLLGSLRKNGKRIATIEFDASGRPIQMKGPCNARLDSKTEAIVSRMSKTLADLIANPKAVPEPEKKIVAAAQAWTGREETEKSVWWQVWGRTFPSFKTSKEAA